MRAPKKILKLALGIIVFSVLIVIPNRANAATQQQLDFFRGIFAGKVPTDISDDIAKRCLDSGWSIYAAQWLSAPGAPASTSVTASYGATSVNLDLNYITYRCKTKTNPTAIAEYFEISNAPKTNLGTYVSATNYPTNNNSGQYNTGVLRQVIYNNGTPMSSGLYTINYTDRGFRAQSNGNYCAIHNPGDYSGTPSPPPFGKCTYGNSSFYIYVNVQPQLYDGFIQTNKRLTDGSLVPWSAQPSNPPFSSYVELFNPNGGVFGGSNLNPSKTLVWVRWDNHASNQEGRYVGDRVAVPSGWKINRVQTSIGNQPLANNGWSCTDNVNKTGTCVVNGLTVRDNTTTYVDWFYEKIPDVVTTLDVSCISDNEQNTGGKITVSASSNAPGDNSDITVKQDYDKNPPNSNLVLTTNPYTFEIDPIYRDGREHNYFVRYKDLLKSVSFGPNSSTCKINKWYYPWLQTKQGDVVADGHINGQVTSGDGVEFPGAKLDSATDQEAEFLIISAIGGGNNFCSTYDYILTNVDSQSGDCTNGTGYNFNSTAIDLFNTNNTTGKDRVITGVSQAFSDNGKNSGPTPSACTAAGISTATATSLPSTISTDCSGGIIYSLPSGTSSGTTLNKGRATIYVEGNLFINGAFNYGTTQYIDPKQTPNLAIVVNGDVSIASSVGSINAMIYSSKKIYTCTSAAGVNDTAQNCSNKLTVNGSLIAKNGFDFRRTFIDETNRTSAELIKLTSQGVTFPPPGIESRYFYNDFSSYKLDTAEYQPRF